jgi:hypothetical protein
MGVEDYGECLDLVALLGDLPYGHGDEPVDGVDDMRV